MSEVNRSVTVKNLRRSFSLPSGGERCVLRDVNFHLEAGQSLAIQGPSGSGKSTLLNCLGALDRPDSGSISVNNLDVVSMNETQSARFRNKEIGFVFQDHHLLYACSVTENVLLPTLAFNSSDGAVDYAESLLERVGLGDRKNSFPHELSGGESQRVAFCRALINKPTVLLCDEPTGSLDRDNGRRIADLLIRVAKEQDVIVIVASHDHEFAERFDRLACLEDGIFVRSDQ